MPIDLLKTDFTNIPKGTKLTVGSILFSKLELPTEEPATSAPVSGQGEQLTTRKVSRPGGAGGEAAEPAASSGTGGRGATEEAAEGDSFTRIEIRVGRITKVR